MRYYYERPNNWAIAGDILSNENFKTVFNKIAKVKIPGGEYPVIQLRKLMWELRMKPLKKEFWES